MAVLTVENLSKSYGKIKAVSDISFSVNAGEIVGFIGPNGAGKTTVMKSILGILKPDSGKVTIGGYSMPGERVRALSMLTCWLDISNLYHDLTARDHIEFVARTRKIPNETVDKYVQQLDVARFMSLKIRKYSYGMKQRLGLTLAAMAEPKLLIIDEPTNGLDPLGILAFREVLKTLSSEHNTAVFFSSHSLSELDKLIDRALFIKKGKLIHSANHSKEQHYILKVSNHLLALKLLQQRGISAIEHCDDAICLSGSDEVDSVISLLYESKVRVLDVFKEETQLEGIFYNLFVEE